jgi:hypothetical protein
VKITTDAQLTPAQVAKAFCELYHDQQATFFEEVGKIAATWPAPARFQWHALGRHMKTCACSTSVGRRVIEDIHDALTESPDAR